jgi:hypothetical protein
MHNPIEVQKELEVSRRLLYSGSGVESEQAPSSSIWKIHRRFHEFRELHAALGETRQALLQQQHLQQQRRPRLQCLSGSDESESVGKLPGPPFALPELPPFPSSSVLPTVGGGSGGSSRSLAALSGLLLGRGGSDPALIEASERKGSHVLRISATTSVRHVSCIDHRCAAPAYQRTSPLPSHFHGCGIARLLSPSWTRHYVL